MRDSGCQVGSGCDLELDGHLVGEDGPQLADPAVEGSQALDRRAEDRQRVRRTGASRQGPGSRSRPRPPGGSARTARSRRARSAAMRSAWRAFSSMLRRSARAVSASARRSRAAAIVSRSRSSWARASSPCSQGDRGLLDRLLGDLEPAGVAIPARVQVVERPVELPLGPARAAVGAADRGLQAVAQRALVARQVAQLEMVDRGRRPEEALGRDPGQFRHDLVGEGRVGDRLALVVEADRSLGAGDTSSRACRPSGRPRRPARTRR